MTPQEAVQAFETVFARVANDQGTAGMMVSEVRARAIREFWMSAYDLGRANGEAAEREACVAELEAMRAIPEWDDHRGGYALLRAIENIRTRAGGGR